MLSYPPWTIELPVERCFMDTYLFLYVSLIQISNSYIYIFENPVLNKKSLSEAV